MGYTEVGEADGWFGPFSERAVKSLQRDLGITDDGIVGRQMWSLLFFDLTPEVLEVINLVNKLEKVDNYTLKDDVEDLILEDGPGYPIRCEVSLYSLEGILRKAELTLVGDGSGYDYTTYYSEKTDLIHIKSRWWGYDFESDQIETRSVTNYYFSNNECIAASHDLSQSELRLATSEDLSDAVRIVELIEKLTKE